MAANLEDQLINKYEHCHKTNNRSATTDLCFATSPNSEMFFSG